MMMTGSAWSIARILRSTSMPFIVGIRTSRSTASGRCRASAAVAPSSRSTAPRFPPGSSSRSSSATKKGAFTGAHRRKPGQFEYAHKGTIYLDEIAEHPLALQAKLLHVLQDLRFARVGGHGMIDVDTRIVAATNRDLE